MTQSTIFLVRHGITEFNVQNRIQGELDSKLTEEGKKYSANVGTLILTYSNNIKFNIISSPLLRAVQTANIIGKELLVNPILDERIVELKRGLIEGKIKEEFTSSELTH